MPGGNGLGSDSEVGASERSGSTPAALPASEYKCAYGQPAFTLAPYKIAARMQMNAALLLYFIMPSILLMKI